MLKNLTHLIIFSIFFILPVLAKAETLPKGNFKELRYMGVQTVQRIVDPQTLQLGDGRFVRLAGIDIPDFDPHNPGNLSITAMQVLGDMLVGKSINLYQTKGSDLGRTNRMGHHIGHIQRREDEIWAQGALLELGLARVRTTKRNPEMAEQMYALEQKARSEKLGLWEIPDFQIHTPDNAKKHIGGFQIIEGKIESAALKNNRIYLNFGLNWKDDFTVSITTTDRRDFTKQGLDPLQWNGKTVRVRGWLESYNGPYMEIDHPERIEDLTLDINP